MAKRKQNPKQNLSGKIRVFKAPMEVGRKNVTIVLPREVLGYIKAEENGNELFWSPVNGVIQICGEQPHMIIPMISVNEDEFLPQDAQQVAPIVAEDED